MTAKNTQHSQSDASQPILLVKEFSKLARLSPKTTLKLIRAGRIKTMPNVRPYRIHKSQLDRLFNLNGDRA